jgi:alpha-L-arabinofuranosidase
MSEEDDEIKIKLDCDVENDYEAYVISGEKTAENSFEHPQNICDISYRLTGSAREFTYNAPALSVNVIRLKKRT